MSTRSQIRFKFPDGNVLTYRHSDGYPSAVIPDLIAFLKWHKPRNDQYEYVVPNYFYYFKREHEEKYSKYKYGTKKKLPYVLDRVPMDGNDWVLLGYGLTYDGKIQGDIDYFYDLEFIEAKDHGQIHGIGTPIKYKITCYEYDISYELEQKIGLVTPEQFIGVDRKPMIVIEIDDLDTYRIPSTEFLEKIPHIWRERKQAKCEHQWTTPRKDRSGYCKICYLEKKDCNHDWSISGFPDSNFCLKCFLTKEEFIAEKEAFQEI